LTEQQCGKLVSSYNILKGSGTISTFQRYFNSMNFALLVIDHTKQNGQFNWESQSVYLGFNYRFGSGKTKPFKENKETRMKPKVAVDFYKISFKFCYQRKTGYANPVFDIKDILF
jgi:hypothetical protein